MIRLGLRLDHLGTEALSWRDLLVIVKQSPRDSAIGRATLGEASGWGLPEHLLAAAVDALRTIAWMQSEDGAKDRNRPKQIQRPGVKPAEDERTFGNASEALEDMAAWLNSRNPNQQLPVLRVIQGGANG